ncbi:MAG: hypothetical protein LBJ32_04500 [Oscillospiraceae bacterium]|jgi:hypothetical protein|nr:hypothetical protein [Oscillospiraceae bacterium]
MSKYKIFNSFFLLIVFATTPAFKNFAFANDFFIEEAKAYNEAEETSGRTNLIRRRIIAKRKKEEKNFLEQIYLKISKIVSEIDSDTDEIISWLQIILVSISGYKVLKNIKSSFNENESFINSLFKSFYKSGTDYHLDFLLFIASVIELYIYK